MFIQLGTLSPSLSLPPSLMTIGCRVLLAVLPSVLSSSRIGGEGFKSGSEMTREERDGIGRDGGEV